MVSRVLPTSEVGTDQIVLHRPPLPPARAEPHPVFFLEESGLAHGDRRIDRNRRQTTTNRWFGNEKVLKNGK